MRFNVITRVLGAMGVVLTAACGSNSTSPYGGGGGGGGGCTPTASKICTAGGLQFNPTSLTVAAGTTVTWENGDAVAHTVTSATGSTDVYDMALASGTVSHQFTTAGTYNYYCKNHGINGTPPTGMHGTITVQ
jgi:plastocyanin